MDKELLEDSIAGLNKWLESLNHFAEVEGHHNDEVMLVVSHSRHNT